MSGYTPLFDTLTRGTLSGKWPDIGLWPIILSLADKDGIVDCTPVHISAITGLPVDEVIACLQRFCEPDPYSRSQEYEGRRLVRLDDHRDWGWQIVNHSHYREKARLMAKNARDVQSGREAERKRAARANGECPPVSAGVRRSPPVSDPSNANANANAGKKNSRLSGARVPSRHIDLVFKHWQEVHGHPEAKPTEKRRKLISARLKEYGLEALREAISGYALSPFHMGDNPQGTKYDSLELILRDAKQVEQGIQFARDPPKPPDKRKADDFEDPYFKQMGIRNANH